MTTLRSFMLSLAIGAGLAIGAAAAPAAQQIDESDFSLVARGIHTEEPRSFVLDGELMRTLAVPEEQSVSVEAPPTGQGNSPRQEVKTLSEVKYDPVSGLKITFEKTIYADWPGVVEWV
ncbi:MAG: hypothetical protein J6S27_06750, partial [Thermoguttaceae bacterium]|nr:hypothetical protein [Thermoguttaceae bacterium]